ncbi:hypothetical protein HDU97_010249 [Phlyctochytrium planicorne]|nr:hypothetical protein HDU97_010249 [Phlyctochytrium planicorne]
MPLAPRTSLLLLLLPLLLFLIPASYARPTKPVKEDIFTLFAKGENITLDRRGGAPASGNGDVPDYDLGRNLRRAWGTPRNSYPIVLVHGFAGFGKPLLNSLNYWGGIGGDTKSYLESLGYTVFVADMGPVSSNWERACELYAQIKGTRVDYGALRSKTYGFQRYGRDYTGRGFMPDWGSAPDKKVHLLTHSMGGPTANMLLTLLAEGHKGETDATTDGSLSELFRSTKAQYGNGGGASKFVSAVLNLAAPHRGTTLDDLITGLGLTNLLVDAIVGVVNVLPGLYDIKLDHWGLKWDYERENIGAFINRLLSSNWAKSKSTSLFDLSVKGVYDPINSWIKVQPDIYYFSSQSYATLPNLITGTQFPELTVTPLFQPLSLLMGSTPLSFLPNPSDWYKNDGVVNLVSMSHPPCADNKVDFNWGDIDMTDDGRSWWGGNAAPSRPTKGIYQVVGPVMSGYDHLDVTGTFSLSPAKAYVIARNAASILSSVP